MSLSSVLKCLLPVCVFTLSAVSSVESYFCATSGCLNGICSTDSGECESPHGCFSQVQEFIAPALSSNLTAWQKGCHADVCTNLTFSATLGEGRTFRFDHQCCEGDRCNQGDLPAQPSLEANGVQCLAFYVDAGQVGLPTLLNCTGSETHCVLAFGSVANDVTSQLVMMGIGCATETACDLNITVFDNINLHTFCTRRFPVSEPSSTVPTTISSPFTNISTVPTTISSVVTNFSAVLTTTSSPPKATDGIPPLTATSSVLTGLLLLNVLL